MSRKLIGVVLLLTVGAIAIIGAYFLLPLWKEREQRNTSNAGRTLGRITIAMDSWIGYFPLRSPEMRSAMRRAGWQLVLEDDKADYRGRMEKLKKGEIDLAVATVDSYLLNAQPLGFPGTIISIIDESKGGDGILAKAAVVKNLIDLKGKNRVRVAFTPNSPSHHLLKAAVDHFNVPELLPVATNERIETNGSGQALQKLMTGKTDLAVLWEPDVSKALAVPGVVKLLGTEDTERLIVDILVVGRKFSKDRPDLVNLLLLHYFRILKKYRDNPNLLRHHIREETDMDDAAIDSMLKGIAWVNFGENCDRWFGVAAPGATAQEGLVETIFSTASILVNAGDFQKTPVPEDDPYRLINSGFLEALFTTGMGGFTVQSGNGPPVVGSLEARFSPLDPAGWERLKEVGLLKVEPIAFQSGSADLDLLAKAVVDHAVERLRHYPNFRVVIEGHTGTRGDAGENKRLSRDRADAVAKYLEIAHGVDTNRLRPIGFGGEKPLSKRPDESGRAYEYRLPRVELVLVREDI